MLQTSDIPLTITRKDIKHLYLRIDSDGHLQVSAPKHMPEREIMLLITDKRAWIIQKQQQHQAKPRQNPNSFTLFGVDYPIIRRTGQDNRLSLIDGTCEITGKSNDKALEAKIILEYQRQQLIPILQRHVDNYTPIIGVAPSEIRTKNMKTKWGTCNIRAKRLWFNVQLTRFPQKHIEYVVVHEMVHLLEPSHNQRFYRLVSEAMPDWENYHTALRHA